MAIFFYKDVRELLENKKVIVIGDSIQRSVYKDLICLWTQEDSRYLFQRELRAKGELAFLGDKLLHGGKLEGKMVNGTGYREVREFSDGKVFFKYYFVTRSYSEHMVSILNELKTCQPDVIVMNSTFWDLHHYGDTNLEQYKANLDKLLKDISENLSSSLLFIWNAALPLADRCKGGFLRKGFLTIPIDKIKTANKLAWLATTTTTLQQNEQKKVYLDLFSELKDKDNFQQAEDGIHWGMRAHRKISNLILTEVCKSWNKKIPDLPLQALKRPDNRASSPVPWSSYYPDNDTWSPSPAASYNDGYELDYWNYVPYWDSPSFDRYQTPSPLLYGNSSPYGNSWSNVSWGYNVPFTSISGRAREYHPSPPVPYLFQRRYLPLDNLQLNFSTPQGPFYPGNVLFKPANSDPLPFRGSFGQGLLPTPPGPPSFAYFSEGDRYRDRFKKLSNPRVRRFKASSTTTSTPLSTSSVTRQSASNETPQNPLSANQNAKASAVSSTDNSDHNNNQNQNGSVNESFPKTSSDSDGIDVGTGVSSIDTPSQPPNDISGTGGSGGDPGTQTKECVQVEEDVSKESGVKRKHEDDEETKPCKMAREDITEAQRSGEKRKREDDDAVSEPKPLMSAHNDSCSLVDDAVACENKRRRGDDDATEKPNPLLLAESSSLEETNEEPPNNKASPSSFVHDVVRCALTYDSFI